LMNDIGAIYSCAIHDRCPRRGREFARHDRFLIDASPP
jgi:hypothetical protein